ncbi:MAG: photosynthetic reaction center subunit H [Pseudomonadota bacterium]
MTENFLGTIDFAAVAIWMFWLFFAGLIFYIQRENMREGYPLENDDGETSANQGPYPVPEDKTFLLRNGHGEYTCPSGQKAEREDLKGKLAQTGKANGMPFEPTGNPLVDGVGPASWQNRRDEPELDAHGHVKIVPLSSDDEHMVSAGRDPRGMPVVSGDNYVVGTVTDIWIDIPEALVRYVEFELANGKGKRLVPLTLASVWSDQVKIKSLYAEHYGDVPTTKSPTQITMLEEEKICAFYAGGYLYSSADRADPVI